MKPCSAAQSLVAFSDQSFENRLEIEGRAADNLEHVGGGSLLLERLAQLVEQARVLDGDDRLGGEILDQLDLLVGEGRTSCRSISMAPIKSSSFSIGTVSLVRTPAS